MSKVVQLKNIKDDFLENIEKLINLSKSDIEEINNLIISKLDTNVSLIKEMANYVVLSSGKRLRPLLTTSCARMCNYGFKEDENLHITLATAIEFIHTATLMHDDVLDESELRRGKLSSNEIWGNKSSVLVGDYLFSKAFQLMASVQSEKILKLLSDTSVIISEGEMLELSNDRDPTISEDTYFKVIYGKTGSLFSAACEVSGIISKLENNKNDALKTFGTNFGIAYQLVDDALDYSSSSSKFGKNRGDDFKEGKITLPIILAYLRSDRNEKQFWNRTIKNLKQNPDDLSKGIELINKYNCIEDTLSRAEHFGNIAIDSLGIFEENIYKKTLLDLVKSSLKRIK